ncbi:MAG: hypothetical protein IKX23_06895 [Treponema sp.]|nr:hypothetical protein [Treponema sp.]
MRKISIISLLMVLLSTGIFAQETQLGVQAGYLSWNSLEGDSNMNLFSAGVTFNKYTTDTSGIYVSLFMEFPLDSQSEGLILDTSLGYSFKVLDNESFSIVLTPLFNLWMYKYTSLSLYTMGIGADASAYYDLTDFIAIQGSISCVYDFYAWATYGGDTGGNSTKILVVHPRLGVAFKF